MGGASRFRPGRVGEQSAGGLPVLRGERVVLRPLTPADIEAVAVIQSEPAVVRWWGAPNRGELLDKAEGRDEATAFAIEVEGALVGLIQYGEETDPEFRRANMDIFLAERAHGRGLGPDALRTLARYLIDERGHHRITIDPTADNFAAVRAYAKVGFRPVGIMRRYWRDPEGNWRDGLLMDLLAGELE